MEIQRVNVGETAVVDAWYEVYERSDRYQRPFAVPWLRGELAVQFEPNLRRESSMYAVLVDGRVVCAGTLEAQLLDNTHVAVLGVYTDPSRRRSGYGAAMLAHLEGVARVQGRGTTVLEVSYPFDSLPQGRDEPGPDFARAHGYTFGLGSIMRSLPVPIAADRLTALSEAAAANHCLEPAYRLDVFIGRVPDVWVADYVALDAHVGTDAPSGTLEVEPASTEVEPFRELEARIARQDRVSYTAVALHGADVVGFTTMNVSRKDPLRGYQWGTMVADPHRGHRLGLALKVANHQQLQVHEPQLRSVVTWNAEANSPMIAVNDQLGFVPVERFAEFEKRW